MAPKKTTALRPWTSSILPRGKRVVTTMVDGGAILWLGLALSYVLLV